MKRELGRWMHAITRWVPSRVGTALLGVAWLALTLLFAFVGNVAVLTVVSAMGQSLDAASLVVTVVGVFSTPALSLVLAWKVVTEAVVRFELLVRRLGAMADGRRLDHCETDARGRCQAATCC
jgi:hypothetical protein